ncbi:MAG TPA: MoxR family ATPase [Ilumatobacter sp.]|nr:MoxR family ATPase [Ilumatobacter sp.]
MLGDVITAVQALVSNVETAIRGKHTEVRQAICCLLTEGHLLLDDVPGTGKTTLAKSIAQSIDGDWKRVQFTPDLLPSDITGVMVYDQSNGQFRFREGPVFTNVLIGDEINRGSPKTQSALLEVMEERQVTTDGVSRRVPRPFFVIATQNPRDSQGTFPLPDVQLDRFAMRVTLGYADRRTETELLSVYNRQRSDHSVSPVVNAAQLEQIIDVVDSVEVAPSINDYIVAIATATRDHPDVRVGVSTRGCISLLRVSRAWAATAERAFVSPDDVQDVARAVCAHRMSLTPEATMRGVRADDIVESILDTLAVPRRRESGA